MDMFACLRDKLFMCAREMISFITHDKAAKV